MNLVHFSQAKATIRVGNVEMIHYSLCNLSELMSLLQIRNLHDVRQYMATTNPITVNSHEKWIKYRMHLNYNNAYYLVKVNGVVDGSVGFWLDNWKSFKIGNWSLYRDVRKASLTVAGAYEFCALFLFFAYLSENIDLISYTIKNNPIRKIHALAGFTEASSEAHSMVQVCSKTNFFESKIYKRYSNCLD